MVTMKYLIVVSVVIQLASAVPVENVPLTSLGGQVDALAAHLMRCRRLPGLTIAVARATPEGGRQVLTRSYGVADVSANRTIDVNTRFCLAGVTQSFTAATLAQLLHENDSFSLDSTIQSMLGTWFQLSDASRTRRVTVRDILSHRVGLAPYFGGVVLGYNLTRIELIRRLRHIPVMAPFRHSFVPNPLLYVLAGHLVQNFNGTFWENVVMQRLFKPLHMTGSTFADRVPNWAANFALPHVLRDGQLVPISSKITGNILRPVGPSNSICSTAPDMAEWMLMLLRNGTSHGDPVLDQGVIDEIFTAQNTHLPGTGNRVKGTLPVNITTDAYNLGWFSGTYKGHKRVFQNGFANYFGSFVTLFPDNGLGIFTAANGPSLTGMDNAFRALHYSIADLALGESEWLNESTVCTYPKPWILSQKKAVSVASNETKTTSLTTQSDISVNKTDKVDATTKASDTTIKVTDKTTKITDKTPKTDKATKTAKITEKPLKSTNNFRKTTETTTESDVFFQTSPFELKKVTTETVKNVKNNTRRTTLRSRVTPKHIDKQNQTLTNDVTSQSRLRTIQTTSESLETIDINKPNESRPLVYISSSSFRNNHTNSTPTETKPSIYSTLLARTKPMLSSRNKTTTEPITRKTTTTSKLTVTTTIAVPSTSLNATTGPTKLPKTTTPTTTSATTVFKTPSSLPLEEIDDDIEAIFDGTFGMRLPSDFDDSFMTSVDKSSTPKPKSVKTLRTFPSRSKSTDKLSTRSFLFHQTRKFRPTVHPFISRTIPSYEPTKSRVQQIGTFSGNERENTIGRLQQSESVLVWSTTPHSRIRPYWLRRNNSLPIGARVSALDEIVMKFVTSTPMTTKLNDDFNAYILKNPLGATRTSTSTASSKMDHSIEFFSDVSTSSRNPVEDFLLEDMETLAPPSKAETVFTSGQFSIIEGTQSSQKVNKEFKSGGNNLGFNFPQSFWSQSPPAPTVPTLQLPKRQRLLFSSKRRLSNQHRQSRRSTEIFDSVTESSLIEDDITETLLKFGVRRGRRDRLKREGKLPEIFNPFPDHVASYKHPFFGNVVIFFNKTSGTLQMEYGFYGKAQLIPYVQSNTFLLRFFSAVWYVSESDDSKRLPRSVFLVYFKGTTSDGKPERFIVPFFDPRLPPSFSRIKSIDEK